MTDTQTDVRYASPQEWVAFLKTPGLKKHQTQFANPDDTEARCCLGHYCVLNEWPLEDSWGEFESFCPEEYDDYEPVINLGSQLPADHWLFKPSQVVVSNLDGGITPITKTSYHPNHQTNLVVINDSTDGFDEVISYIETYIIGAQS